MSLSDLPEIESNCDDYYVPPEKFEPDKGLLNWEALIAERTKLHAKFKKSLGRSKAKLLINASEDCRELNEKKRMIEHGQIWEKYRGKPVVAPKLAKECPDDLDYYVTLSSMERGLPAKTEFVKVPDVIKEEKGALSVREHNSFNKSKILNKMLNKEYVLEIYPHIPDANEIVVIGQKVKNECFEPDDDHVGDNDDDSAEEIIDESVEVPPEPNKDDYILSLNDLHLFANEKEPRVLTIFVESSPKNVEFSYLFIHNNGEVTLRFYFRKYDKRMILGKRVEEDKNGMFFYNKNTQVLQPGQKMDYSIGFKSNLCGTYTHTMIMQTNPNLWEEGVEILIRLQVIVFVNDFYEFCESINTYLDDCTRAAIIAETIEDCLKKIPPKKSEIITYSYDKKSIFEAVNGFYINNEFFVKYAYDKKVVSELELFYEEVKLQHHPETWDYRIETLKAVTKQRENYVAMLKLQDQLDDLFSKIEECKVKRDVLEEAVNKFWLEDGVKGKDGKAKPTKGKANKKTKEKKEKKKKKDEGKGKKKPAVIIYTETPRDPLPKTLSDDLDDVINKLRSSIAWKDEHARKMKLCLPLVSAYFDKITIECAEVDYFFGIGRMDLNVLNKICVNKQRVNDEEISACKMEYPQIIDLKFDFQQKPCPPWCATIPLEKYQARFDAFKTEKFPPAKKPIVKPISSEELVEEEYLFEQEELVLENEDEIPKDLKQHHTNNLFLIINTNLWKLIDDITAAFELLIPEKAVRLENLELIGLTSRADLPPDENEYRIIDLKKATSELFKFIPKEEPICTCECICNLTPSILDLVHIYQTQSCKDAQPSSSTSSEENVKVFMDSAVMTSPSIDISLDPTFDDGGICGVEQIEPFDCICKKKSKTSFEYYDSEIGFDVVSSLSTGFDGRSCDKNN